MEKLYRILEAVATPICVPLGAEGKLLKCKELVCRRGRGEGSWDCIWLFRKAEGLVVVRRDGASQTHPQLWIWALFLFRRKANIPLAQLSLLAGLDSDKGHALQTGLPEAGQGDRASRAPSLLTAPRSCLHTSGVPLCLIWASHALQAPDLSARRSPRGGWAETAPESIPEGSDVSSGLLLSLGPGARLALWRGWERGAAWLGPAVTVGQDLPCPIPCRFPGGQSGVWWYPIPVWVPSANPGHGSHQVLGKVHQGCSTG